MRVLDPLGEREQRPRVEELDDFLASVPDIVKKSPPAELHKGDPNWP